MLMAEVDASDGTLVPPARKTLHKSVVRSCTSPTLNSVNVGSEFFQSGRLVGPDISVPCYSVRSSLRVVRSNVQSRRTVDGLFECGCKACKFQYPRTPFRPNRILAMPIGDTLK